MHMELEQVLVHQENLCPADRVSLQLLLAYSLVHAFAVEKKTKMLQHLHWHITQVFNSLNLR